MYFNFISLILFFSVETHFLVLQSNMLPFFLVLLFLVSVLAFSTEILSLSLDLELSEYELIVEKNILECLIYWHFFILFRSTIVLGISIILLYRNLILSLDAFSILRLWDFKNSNISYNFFFQKEPFHLSTLNFLNSFIDVAFFLKANTINDISVDNFLLDGDETLLVSHSL